MHRIRKVLSSAVCSLMLFCSPWVVAELSVNGQWQVFNSSDGSNLSRRHEAAGVVVGDFIYLLGGRSNRPVERYSVVTEQWENLGAAPMELHHMQPVAIDDKIYVLGAFSCCYPNEELVSQIYVFVDLQVQPFMMERSIY